MAGQVVTVDIGIIQPGVTVTIQIYTIANDLAEEAEICNTVTLGTLEAIACINIFPDELPPTGGEPVRSWLWLMLAGVVALGAGAVTLKKRMA